MSSTLAKIRFQDGTIVLTRYQGTSDHIQDPPTLQACGLRRRPPAASHEPVEATFATNYGAGMHWKGKACKKCGAILEYAHPYDISGPGFTQEGTEIQNGLPEWWEANEEKPPQERDNTGGDK